MKNKIQDKAFLKNKSLLSSQWPREDGAVVNSPEKTVNYLAIEDAVMIVHTQ
jgi:hypothetical protein